MVEQKKENQAVTSILFNIKNWFAKKKPIARIRISTPKQTFWVSNPKKMKFWRAMAVNQAGALVKKPGELPGVKITKVVYVGDKK